MRSCMKIGFFFFSKRLLIYDLAHIHKVTTFKLSAIACMFQRIVIT